MVVVKINLKDYPSHRQMTTFGFTFGFTFALSIVFRNDSQSEPFPLYMNLFYYVCCGDNNESPCTTILQKGSCVHFVNNI